MRKLTIAVLCALGAVGCRKVSSDDLLAQKVRAVSRVARAIADGKARGYTEEEVSVAKIGSGCKGGHCATMYLVVFSLSTPASPRKYGAVLATAVVDPADPANNRVRLVGLR